MYGYCKLQILQKNHCVKHATVILMIYNFYKLPVNYIGNIAMK